MRQLASLAWKEWREVRWVVGFALIMFIGLPLVGGIEGRRYAHGFEFIASPWVMFLGGLLATVVAATAVCRDLNAPLVDFWRSRAVATGRWLLIKYGVGLAVVLLCCLIPVILEELLVKPAPRDEHFGAVVAAWFPFVCCVQYSLGFFSGAVARRPGPAIMLALALSMLAYFLPMILPPLRSLNVPEVFLYSSDPWPAAHGATQATVPWVPWPVPFAPRRQMPFLIGAVVMSAVALLFSIVAIRREWRIRAAQKLTYWSIAGAILLLFASASFQLGTNLPVLQKVDLEPTDQLAEIRTDGHRGAAFFFMRINPQGSYLGGGVRPFEINQSGVQVGGEVQMRGWPVGRYNFQTWLPAHPDYCFVLREPASPNVANSNWLELGVFDLRRPADPLVKTVNLGAADPAHTHGVPHLCTVGDQLYAVWWKDRLTPAAVIIDVRDPTNPHAVPSKPFFPGLLSGYKFTPVLRMELLPVRDSTVAQRLTTTVDQFSDGRATLAGDVMVTSGWGEGYQFSTYRLSQTTTRPAPLVKRVDSSQGNETVEFERIGGYEPSLLESVLGSATDGITTENGMVYVSEQSMAFGGGLSRLTVFDLSNPARPTPIAHFATPDNRLVSVCPLPDGRVLLGGKSLYLLGRPPGR
jgi:hypothetical protein